jgi:transposase
VPKPQLETGTEVVPLPQSDRRKRRHFSSEEKIRILRDADAATKRGELASFLRQEGIYSSHLSIWRGRRRSEGEAALGMKKPGPKPTKDEKDRTIERLEKENAKLERELSIVKKVVELQIKAHEIFGIALPKIEETTEDDSPSSSDSATRRSR